MYTDMQGPPELVIGAFIIYALPCAVGVQDIRFSVQWFRQIGDRFAVLVLPAGPQGLLFPVPVLPCAVQDGAGGGYADGVRHNGGRAGDYHFPGS
jgi:hypothetical protein